MVVFGLVPLPRSIVPLALELKVGSPKVLNVRILLPLKFAFLIITSSGKRFVFYGIPDVI